MNGCSQSVAANQNSTSSIQITLFVNRFMLKGRHLLPLETLPVFRGNTVLQKHTTELSLKKVTYRASLLIRLFNVLYRAERAGGRVGC
jgi:hypothetical protein